MLCGISLKDHVLVKKRQECQCEINGLYLDQTINRQQVPRSDRDRTKSYKEKGIRCPRLRGRNKGFDSIVALIVRQSDSNGVCCVFVESLCRGSPLVVFLRENSCNNVVEGACEKYKNEAIASFSILLLIITIQYSSYILLFTLLLYSTNHQYDGPRTRH